MTTPTALFEAYIANCLFIGEKKLDLGGNGWTRALITLSLDGRDVELREERDIVTATSWSPFRGKWIHTTTLLVSHLPESDRDWAVNMARSLATLLMFATSSEVAFAGWSHTVGPLTSRQWSTSGMTNYSTPVLDLRDGATLRRFLETGWSPFIAEQGPRNLAAVFHYLALAEREDTPIEMQLALHFIVLEQLKHSFAVSNGYVFIAPHFHLPGTVKGTSATSRGFRKLLEAMFHGVGMQPSLTDIVDLRNEILHSGLSARPFAELVVMRGNIIVLVREYLLRLLGYKGAFFTGQSGGIAAVIA